MTAIMVNADRRLLRLKSRTAILHILYMRSPQP